MDEVAVISIAVLVGFLMAMLMLIYSLIRKNNEFFRATEIKNIETGARMDILQSLVSSIKEDVSEKLSYQSMSISEQSRALDEKMKVFSELKEKLGGLEESNRNIIDAEKQLGSAIHDLRNIFTASKSRGISGEVTLENLLSQYIPGNYNMQYSMGDVTVDAVIRAGDYIVPVDSKFPYFDKFNEMISVDDSTPEGKQLKAKRKKELMKAVKLMIDDASRKYILPGYNTTNFAMIYIPAENIYYELVVNDPELEMARYSMEKNVIVVSPSTMLSYLYTIYLGLRGMKIENNAKNVYKSLLELGRDFEHLRKDLETTGKHILNAYNKISEVNGIIGRLQNKIEGVEKLGYIDENRKITEY